MARFLVFAFDDYYPHGGINDCKARSGVETVAINRAVALCANHDNVHVYDVEDNKIVWHNGVDDGRWVPETMPAHYF